MYTVAHIYTHTNNNIYIYIYILYIVLFHFWKYQELLQINETIYQYSSGSFIGTVVPLKDIGETVYHQPTT